MNIDYRTWDMKRIWLPLIYSTGLIISDYLVQVITNNKKLTFVSINENLLIFTAETIFLIDLCHLDYWLTIAVLGYWCANAKLSCFSQINKL